MLLKAFRFSKQRRHLIFKAVGTLGPERSLDAPANLAESLQFAKGEADV